MINIMRPSGGVTNHGALLGLSDDDHLQYLTDARHDSLAADNPHSVTFTQAVTADAGTDISAFEAETLTDGSNADALHVHDPIPGADHGDLLGLSDDDHAQYLLLAGRAGGQTSIGGTAVSEELVLRGTTNANLGLIRAQSPIVFDDQSAANALSPYFIAAAPTQNPPGAFIGGGMRISPITQINNGLFIWEGQQIAPDIISNVQPSFAAFTLLNALPLLRTITSFSPLNALTLNVGVTMAQGGIVQSATTASNFGVSFSPQVRVTGIFSTMSVTAQTAVSCRPTFSTIANSQANLGTIRGLHQQNPTVALFQPQAGTETMTANIAVDVDNIAFGGNVTKAAVRSAQAAASNAYFLLNTGTARSNLGSSNIEHNDLFGPLLGNSQDLSIGWGPSGFLFFQFNTGSLGQLRISSEVPGNVTQRILFGASIADVEFNFSCHRFTIGAQSASIGNGVGAFITPVRSTTINGGWADFNLTHAGNLTLANAMSEIIGWNINQIVLTAGGGSISDYIATLNISGMTTGAIGSADTHAIRARGRRTGLGVDAFESLSPAALTVDVNDFAPATGNNMRQVWRLTTDDLGAVILTGIAVQQSVDTQWITNVGTVDNIVLSHQDALSAASNRIISPTGANLTLGPDESALLWHDDVTDRWRILYHTGA